MEMRWQERLERRQNSRDPWLIIPSDPCNSDACRRIDYGQVSTHASELAAGLQSLGLGPNAGVVVICDNSAECCLAIIAVLLAGAPLVPLSPRPLGASEEIWIDALKKRMADSGAALVLCFDTRTVERLQASDVRAQSLRDIPVLPSSKLQDVSRWDSIAILQYTSGTTGAARCVQITHANLTANIDAIGQAVCVTPRDVVGSWLPLFHDMGLVGSFLFATYWQLPIVVMTPRTFLRRPEAWLWAISRYRVTCSAAPNSAYDLCARRVAPNRLRGLDLSSWRAAVNGGEHVHSTTLERFNERFEPFGFRRGAMQPVYGLAECTVAATFGALDAATTVHHLDEERLALGEVRRAISDQAPSRKVVGLGHAISRHRVRIVCTSSHRVLADEEIGEVQLQGPSVTQGYRGQDPRLLKTPDGWLRTGDRGYLAQEGLFVLGRFKHVIKRGGACVDAAFLENLIKERCPPSFGAVAVFGRCNSEQGREEVVVWIEAPRQPPAEAAKTLAAIREDLSDVTGAVPDHMEFVPPGSIRRTTSGKVQHAGALRNTEMRT